MPKQCIKLIQINQQQFWKVAVPHDDRLISKAHARQDDGSCELKESVLRTKGVDTDNGVGGIVD